MNAKRIVMIGATIIPLLAGCALTQVVLDPVGPAFAKPKPPAFVSTGQGWLRVYTATDIVPDGDATYYYPHTGYRIYTENGKLLKYVPNHIVDMDESATLLEIHAGHYKILAQSERYNAVLVPVTIQPGEITEVHLGTHWKAPSNTPTNELVYLPDGRPVGWKSTATN